jgi:hypothetical protein
VNERQEREASEETFVQALHRMKKAALPERIEGEPETARIPFEELDERPRGSSAEKSG